MPALVKNDHAHNWNATAIPFQGGSGGSDLKMRALYAKGPAATRAPAGGPWIRVLHGYAISVLRG